MKTLPSTKARRTNEARRSWRVLLVLAVGASGACGDVPVLVFDDEAGAAMADGSLVDAGSDAVCPNQLPVGSSVCCGPIACNGNCTVAQCTACEMQCGIGTLCCAKTNNVACRPMGASCP
ncbi:MAG TPA: hypothetical protein VK841_12635 [Polyangiaceae bacterium]|nr:hypothetical protein [Polyangiaceae bacterium]